MAELTQTECRTLDRETSPLPLSSPTRPPMGRPGDRRWVRLGVWIGACIGAGTLLDGPHPLQVGAILGSLIWLTGSGRRSVAALFTVIGFRLSFPPDGWPLYLCCFGPAVWLWRGRHPEPGRCPTAFGRAGWAWEALGVGFAMCWMTTAFVRAGYGKLGIFAHTVMSLCFGLQVLGIAWCLRLSRDLHALAAAPTAALGAVAIEFIPSAPASWMLLPLHLPAASTPLAQWAFYAGPFGVSGILYLVNFWCWMEWTGRGRDVGRWRSVAAGSACLSIAWFGGMAMASNVTARPLSFRVLIVQPNLRGGDGVSPRPWVVLDRLTRSALKGGPDVDLIIWPETVLSPSLWPMVPGEWADGSEAGDLAIARDFLPLEVFDRVILPRYGGVPCLVGIALTKTEPTMRYGVTVREARTYNSACLVVPGGEPQAHDKLALCPLREGLPSWLDFPGVRRFLTSAFQVDEFFCPGREYGRLKLKDRSGRVIPVGVSICDEMFFPQLPQYWESNRAEVIFHLTNNAWSSGYRDFDSYQLWSCPYRAIETRSWQVISSTFSGSAVIDPLGRILVNLPSKPGTLIIGARSHRPQSLASE